MANLYMNWTGVTVTPESGTAIAIDHVTDVRIDGRSVTEVFYGDARKFPVLIRCTQHSRTLELVGGNAAKLLSIPMDTPCVVAATLNHAEKGTGAGAITVSLANAICHQKPVGGTNNKFASGNVSFMAAGNENDEDPLTITISA